jgi:polysaccharide biosynthesis transport protein
MKTLQTTDYVRILWRRKLLVLLLAIVGGALAFAASQVAKKTYEATTEVFVSSPSSGSNAQDLQSAGVFLSTSVVSYARVATTPAVVDVAAKRLGIQPSSLRQGVTAVVPTGTVIVQISASAPDPADAARRANAVGAAFSAVAPTLVPRTGSGRSPLRVTTVSPAQAPSAPSSPKTKLNTVIGVIIGLLVGSVAAVLRSLVDTRLRTVADIGEVSTLPILASVPRFAGSDTVLPAITGSYGDGEPFRLLRTNLQFTSLRRTTRVFLVTSSLPAEGKSTTVLNLAAVLKQAGESVLLIDADMHRAQLGKYAELRQTPGLSEVLIGAATVADAIQTWSETGIATLAAGALPPNPSELLLSQHMDDLLAEVSQRYQYVIVDSPPVLSSTDAVVLARKVDAVVFVASLGLVRRDAMTRALSGLRQIDAPLDGLVLNRVGRPEQGYAYYGAEDRAQDANGRASEPYRGIKLDSKIDV